MTAQGPGSRNFTLSQLRYFSVVAQEGSMTGAAGRLRITQSALSSAVAQLEAAMGVPLFRRLPRRGLSLTDPGRRLLRESLPLLEEVDRLPALVRGEEEALTGRLVVGVYEPIASVHLPDILHEFEARYPGVDVSLVEGDQETVRQALLSGTCEMGLLYSMGVLAGLETEVLETLPPHVLVAAGHPLARRGTPVRLAELADEPLILLDLPHTREYLAGLFDAAGVAPQVRHWVKGYDTVRSFVARGGYTILNRVLPHRGTHNGGQVVALELRDDLPGVDVLLARRDDTRPTRRAQAFAGLCRDQTGPSVAEHVSFM
ncbi:LysR family transcriptional regulator [Kineosporia sp. J2-2]|uniref:LysR family transcriptional regulator n=2 Tax=Kineosporia corallincola TaxID=2835133 RepID=A0ABS5TMG4_9ACTN|nr:LysR family transcriptional regulator [Kineosporia corallincola]